MDEWFCPECAAPGAAPTAGNVSFSGRACWGGGGLLVLWENLQGSPAGQPRLQGDAPRLLLSPPARMGAWQPHVSPGFSFFPDAGPVSEEEVSLILADVVPTTSRLRPHVGRTRAIARTRQSERVRATVNRNRISTARRIQVGAHDAVAARLLLVQPLWVLPAPVLVHLGCPNALGGGHSGGVRMAGWGLRGQRRAPVGVSWLPCGEPSLAGPREQEQRAGLFQSTVLQGGPHADPSSLPPGVRPVL